MPYASADGVRLFYEETGRGTAIVFVHEFAGDYRSWEPQVRHFARRYRCITFNARGYPPSDVPADVNSYSQELAAKDIAAVMDHLGIPKAHIVGISMGAYATVHFGLQYGSRAISLTAAALGYGSAPESEAKFRADSAALADEIERLGSERFAEGYAIGPYRVQFARKDPRGWLEFKHMLSEHSAVGAAMTMRGIQQRRPALYQLENELRQLTVPLLVVVGDEDDWCLEPSIWLKRVTQSAGLLMFPKTGHTVNLEESEAFNRHLQDYFAAVENGAWSLRDPRSVADSALMAWKKT
jgi:pimeloyl-ACP methyl ester carboxylesterase